MIYQNRDLLEGKRISQRFAIKTVTAWKEHAVFCTADDLEKNRPVIIVLIDPLAVSDAELLEKTARRKQKLQHANLVSLLACGKTDEGEPFLAFDRSGWQEFDSILKKKTAHPPGNAVAIIWQIIEGLSFLADNHEGLLLPAPEGLLVLPERTRQIKILDLEFSECLCEKTLLAEKPAGPLQAARYLPPECIKGSKPDARSQIYALGCITYQLLTGNLPHDSDDLLELQSQQLCVRPRRFHEVRPDLYLNPRLETCVLKALNKDPSSRQNSLRQFQTELKEALQQPTGWKIKKQALAYTAAALALLLIGGGLFVQQLTPGSEHTGQTITPPPPVESTTEDPSNIARSTLPPLPPAAIKLGRLELNGSEKKRLAGGNYQCEHIFVSDSAELICDNPVNIWIVPAGADQSGLKLSGNAQLHAAGRTEALNIYYAGDKSILLSDESNLKATVLAPLALLDARGSSTITGSFTSAGQKLSDRSRFVREAEVR